MRDHGRNRAHWWLGGLAVAGVVLTHWIAYLLADVPTEAGTSENVHRYWPLVSALGLGALVAALGDFVLQCGRRPSVPGTRPASSALRLVALQGAGWLALEGGERALLAHHLEGFLAEPVVLVGLLVQGVIAVAGALLLAGLHRAVRALVERKVGPWPVASRAARRPIISIGGPRLRLAASGRTLRGPPLR